MIRRNRAHLEVLRQLWDRLDIVQDAPSWPITNDWQQRCLSANASEILGDLVDAFGQEQLIESGIAEQDAGGQLTMSTRLTSGSATLLALSETAGMQPFDVMLSDGLLLGDETPAYAAVHDYRIGAATRSSDGLLLLVPTTEDVVACHALGLAAVPIAGMDRLDLNQLRQVEELTSVPSQLLLPATTEEPTTDETVPADTSPPSGSENSGTSETQAVSDTETDHDDTEGRPSDDGSDVIDLASDDVLPVEIIFAGWSFVRQQGVPGEQIQEMVARLANAQRYLSIDLADVAVWIPTHNDVENIRFCWELRDHDTVKRIVLESISGACYGLSAAVSGEMAPWQTPDTYLQARSALSRGLRNTESASEDRVELVEAFEHLLQSQIIDPLLEEGVNHRDPIAGALHMELAHISSLLQSQAPFLQHDLMQAGIQVESRDERGTLERSIRIRMQLVDRLVRIVRELRR